MPRINWRVKALLPVLAALLNGVLLFIVATVSLRDPERHLVVVVAALGAIVICLVMLIAMEVVIRRPMLELEQKIRRVREGDLEARVDFASRNDDLGDLGRDFNRMVAQLRESREEIQRLYRTQISRAEHFATLGELAAGLAHEIRNPLAGIAGVAEVVARDLPESSAAREALDGVREEVLRINRIVSDLLETARPKPPQFQAADLNATAEHAVIFARQQSLSRPVQVLLRKAEDLEPVEHDPGQIHQVLLNLILNALQAIDGPGEVQVQVQQRDGSATVTVSDTGKGIAAEHLPNIFRPFFTTKGKGTGLGLSLAHRIVEDHGGRIEVESRVGEGSRFSVLLPLRRAQAPETVTQSGYSQSA